MIGTIYGILFYLATFVLLTGLIFRIRIYAKTPAPLKIAVTPAPTTKLGVIGRQAKEVLLFTSLFKANKWTWLFGWFFHVALLVVIIRHLRYFTDPVWDWAIILHPNGVYAAFVMVIGLAGLWSRRFLVDRVRYISAPSDHLMLILLLAIGLSGLAMKYIAHIDIIALREFTLGLMTLNWQPIPTDPLLLLHLGLVILLMIIFPFSKLLHAPGLFFAPSRYQVDDSRERRYQANRTDASKSQKTKTGP